MAASDKGVQLVDRFEDERSRLVALGYRLTGSFADAEDAVQEAWLRLDGTDPGQIRDLRAWLTTVVSRLCLDRLRSAAKRRENYVGQWLPGPLVTAYDAPADDPLEALLRDEDSRFAALVVLDTLTPDQRVSFVLHDGFGVPYEEIAGILAIQPATARQHASRARKAAATSPSPVSDAEHEAAVGKFMAAMATGDISAIVAVLHPDALVMGDANGTTSTAVNVIHGADKFARFFLGLLRRYGDEALTAMVPVRVNGQLGMATYGWQGPTKKQSSPARIAGFTVRDGLVYASYDIVNPEKFSGVRLADWPVRP
ncbi:MAG: sigma-70 family RNA polymerase sigma factor [Actinomycetota bacterium]|nr:sigma-70 family RNA polymerase sigma factor [Actinomycetota bacterium]